MDEAAMPLDDANALLAAHNLAGLRLSSWSLVDEVARLEVFHVEWESVVFGELVFSGVQYLQMPSRTSWGCQIRLAPEVPLPSWGDVDSTSVVYEIYYPDGGEPSAFLVAERLAIVRSAEPPRNTATQGAEGP